MTHKFILVLAIFFAVPFHGFVENLATWEPQTVFQKTKQLAFQIGRKTIQLALFSAGLDDSQVALDLHLPSSEDDGNTHSFHFDRFYRHKRRLFFILLARSILIITHLCWLVKEICHLNLNQN